jgi:mono/diheme cytochrome c family protein
MVGARPLPLAVLVFFLLLGGPTGASEPVLTIEIAGTQRSLTATQLLDDPAGVEIDVPGDIPYGRSMHYRAIPLDRLLAGFTPARDQVLEAVASDGFVGLLPVDLILHPPVNGSRAYLAVEPSALPWPAIPGQKASAGPFYIVWLNPEAAGVRSEQWPYRVARIRSSDSPARRWPALGVDPALAADDPVRAGQTLFVTQCLACHKLNGAGSADKGPDLNWPANPTEYFQDSALKRYIRDPSALRHWPAMQMHGFDKSALSDHEIDLIVAYLRHMAGRKTTP